MFLLARYGDLVTRLLLTIDSCVRTGSAQVIFCPSLLKWLPGAQVSFTRWCVAVVQNAGSHSEIATADLLAQAWPLMVRLPVSWSVRFFSHV